MGAVPVIHRKVSLMKKTTSLAAYMKRAGAVGSALFASLLFAQTAQAASATATGIDGSFITLLNDLTGMLGGNFGALVLVVSLIIGVGVYAVTSNWRWVIASLMVAFLIGYGVNIIQGIGGVTATVDMVDWPVINTGDVTAVQSAAMPVIPHI